MYPFGDGSDGALNVTSGTRNLALNTKHQFTTVNIASGATLSTSSTTGSVLYIMANNSITINGDIDVSNKVEPGDNTWSVTIDGTTYTSPGVANGGNGAIYTGQTRGLQSKGFGGGGGGAGISSTNGGNGGSGSATAGSGGPRIVSSRSGSNFDIYTNGANGGGSAGGSGATLVQFTRTSGSVSGTVKATSGRGGNAYGGNGENGVSGSVSASGNGSYTYFWYASGGGGAGGIAGKSGVNVVLIAPKVIINGQVITQGTNGGDGGNGGRNKNQGGWTDFWGTGGGAGGGGSAGDITIKYGSEYNAGTYLQTGGSGGNGGKGGKDNSLFGGNGSNGTSGTSSVSQLAPISGFTASETHAQYPLTVYFTSQDQGATSWLWDFGDGATSTTKNPQHTYSTRGTYTVSLQVTNAAGSDTETKTDYITTYNQIDGGISGTLTLGGAVQRPILQSEPHIVGTLTLGGAVQRPIKQSKGKIKGTLTLGGSLRPITLKDTQNVDTKKYLYKVYDEEGNYIEVWKDVISEPNFTAEINQIGSTMDVELARTSDSLGVTTSNLLTENDEVVLTEDNLPIRVRTMSRNQIGPGSSVQYNHRVDVYAYYGSVEPLLTEDFEPITTEDGEVLLASTGAPNGRRIFTGFISEINTRYGNSDTVQLQLTSYGWDLNQYPITNEAGETTVSFLSVDPSDIVRDALDKFVSDSSSYYTYTNWEQQTIESTGTTVSYTFKANTYADVLDKALELMPENWYYYVGLGDNLVYFRERSQTARHRFFLGKHIKALDLKGSILDVKNRVLFTGGGDPALYIERVEAPALNTRRALELYSDGRVTVQDSAEIISDGIIEKANKVNYRTTIEILSGAYDIESINLGDVVGFRNFGNFVDELLLQIVGISYTPDVVQLQLETKPPTINKRLADIQRNLKVQENSGIPDSPS